MASRYLTARRTQRTRRIRWLAITLAGLIGLIGYYGPWVPHKAAGLVVIGLDLAEYVKFIPEVASGKITFRREIFYLPLFAASVGGQLVRKPARPANVEPLADRRPCHPVGVGDASPRLEPRLSCCSRNFGYRLWRSCSA